jgi:iron complex outermembrane receptor protein
VGRPAPRYYALRTYGVSSLVGPYQGINDVEMQTTDNLVSIFSGDIKPERKREVELGFDLRFFEHDRLGIDFSYYNNTVYDQIMAVPLATSSGANQIKINAGEVKNQGIEILLRGKPIVAPNYEWNLSLTVTRQWDEVVKLYPGITQLNTTVGGTGVVNRAEEGMAMGEIWLHDYARDSEGNKLVNGNGMYYLSTDDKDLINAGNVNPDWFGGFTSDFSFHGDWGGLNFTFGLDYRFGGYVMSYSNYYLRSLGLSTESLPYRDLANGGISWTDEQGRPRVDGVILPGKKNIGSATAPQYVDNDIIISAQTYYAGISGTGWMPEDIRENSYIKFRELSLSYTLPLRLTQSAKIQRVTIGFTARNLFYIWKTIDNIDPESTLGTNRWVEYSNYPSSRTFGCNVALGF